MKTLHGDCLKKLARIKDASIDALVTDPPAGISFMGKSWDGDKGGRDAWIAWLTEVMRECYRVLKPGAHGLVWALPRTSHWTATALEDAGFEIRDVVTHLFGTGFPKSLDISKAIDKASGITEWKETTPNPAWRAGNGPDAVTSTGWAKPQRPPKPVVESDAAKQWQGWGTALKPASEHWILVRKPCSEKTVAANVLKWGTGGINIDASRIAAADQGALAKNWDRIQSEHNKSGTIAREGGDLKAIDLRDRAPTGRFPANLVLNEEVAQMLDAQSGERVVAPRGKPSAGGENSGDKYGSGKTNGTTSYADAGGASRFFYVAKASKVDKGADNTHPTVKSTSLMRYLCRLITPPKGVIIDPFMGSGSTGVAAKAEGFKFIGIEMDEEYLAIARARLGITA